jgi:hypothetical protein
MNVLTTLQEPSDSSTVDQDTVALSELESWMAQWLPTLSETAERHDRRDSRVINIGAGSFITACILIVGFCIIWWYESLDIWRIAGIVIGALIGATFFGVAVYLPLYQIFVKPLNEIREKQVEKILSDIRQQNLSKAEIVRGIAAGVRSCKYRDEVMMAIDPNETTLIINHNKTLALLEKFSQALTGQQEVFAVIGEIGQLQEYAYYYASRGFYAEASALLCAAEMLYKAIAAANPQVKWQENNVVYTANAPWSAYSFHDEVIQFSNIVAQRKAIPQVIEMLKAMTGQSGISDVLNIEQGVGVEIRDQEIIDKCAFVTSKFSLFAISKGGLETIQTLSYMPGDPTRFISAAGWLFETAPFVPWIIEACIRRGAEMEPTLLMMFKGENPNGRFNAALALGILRSDQAAQAATEILNNSPDPLTHIGALFILVFNGEVQRHQEILPFLDDADETIVHAAAIALEHLPIPLPDRVLVKQLCSGQRLVKLRLTRHIRKQTDISPDVIAAVDALVTGPDDDVGMAAAETMTTLFSKDMLFNLAKDRLAVAGKNHSICRRLLTMMGRSRTEAAVTFLRQEYWEAIGQGKPDPDYIRHVLACMGETLSISAVPTLILAVKEEDFKLIALQSLLQVAGQHPNEVLNASLEIQNDIIRLFLGAFLSGNVEVFKKKLEMTFNDQLTLILQLAAFLAHPDLESVLNRLRTSAQGNKIQTPTWRYLALKAALAVLIKKTTASPSPTINRSGNS